MGIIYTSTICYLMYFLNTNLDIDALSLNLFYIFFHDYSMTPSAKKSYLLYYYVNNLNCIDLHIILEENKMLSIVSHKSWVYTPNILLTT